MKNQVHYVIKIGFLLALGIVFLTTASFDFSGNTKAVASNQSIAKEQKSNRSILVFMLREIDTVTIRTVARHPWILARIKKIYKSSRTYRKLRIKYKKYLYGKDSKEFRKMNQHSQLPLPLLEFLYLSQNKKKK